jgi:hypothetical protein
MTYSVAISGANGWLGTSAVNVVLSKFPDWKIYALTRTAVGTYHDPKVIEMTYQDFDDLNIQLYNQDQNMHIYNEKYMVAFIQYGFFNYYLKGKLFSLTVCRYLIFYLTIKRILISLSAALPSTIFHRP